MKNSTVWKITNGGAIEQAIKKRYPLTSTGALKLIVADLKGLVDPVLQQLRYEVKEGEREAESARDDASYAWSEAEESKKEIERMEAEQERKKMLEQFYSY